MAKIRGISIDLDGCFLGYSFLNNIEAGVVEANRELIDILLENSSQYQSTTLFVGSNRQSIYDDCVNATSNKNGSGYPRVKQIAKAIRARLDKFLLTDLYNDLPDGTTFKKAFDYLDENQWGYSPGDKSEHEWLHDKSKLTILCAQMYKLSSENSGDEIDFDFYDDKEEILQNLHALFERHPELIPPNVKLNLFRYAGPVDSSNLKIEPLIQPYPSIQGRGIINHHFRETIKEIASQCIQSQNYQNNEPVDSRGQRIKNYADARASNFMITVELNCARDYQPELLSLSSSSSTSSTSSAPSYFRRQFSDLTRRIGFLSSKRKVKEKEPPSVEEVQRNSYPPTLFTATTHTAPAPVDDRQQSRLGRHRTHLGISDAPAERTDLDF